MKEKMFLTRESDSVVTKLLTVCGGASAAYGSVGNTKKPRN